MPFCRTSESVCALPCFSISILSPSRLSSEVTGQDTHERDLEELREDEEVEAEAQDTGQPETVDALGEKQRGTRQTPEKPDFPILTKFGLYTCQYSRRRFDYS